MEDIMSKQINRLNVGFLCVIALIFVSASVFAYTPAPAGALSAKDYGAKGDGVTDDGPALRTALNAIPAGGALAFEPGKTYLIGKGIRADGKNNFHIYGQDATIKAIVKGAKTGQIGDGKIFVMPLERCIRIRTEEEGHDAIG